MGRGRRCRFSLVDSGCFASARLNLVLRRTFLKRLDALRPPTVLSRDLFGRGGFDLFSRLERWIAVKLSYVRLLLGSSPKIDNVPTPRGIGHMIASLVSGQRL